MASTRPYKKRTMRGINQRWSNSLTEKMLACIRADDRLLAVCAPARITIDSRGLRTRPLLNPPKRARMRHIVQVLFGPTGEYDLDNREVLEALTGSVKNKVVRLVNKYDCCAKEVGQLVQNLSSTSTHNVSEDQLAAIEHIKMHCPHYFEIQDIMTRWSEREQASFGTGAQESSVQDLVEIATSATATSTYPGDDERARSPTLLASTLDPSPSSGSYSPAFAISAPSPSSSRTFPYGPPFSALDATVFAWDMPMPLGAINDTWDSPSDIAVDAPVKTDALLEAIRRPSMLMWIEQQHSWERREPRRDVMRDRVAAREHQAQTHFQLQDDQEYLAHGFQTAELELVPETARYGGVAPELETEEGNDYGYGSEDAEGEVDEDEWYYPGEINMA